jgi:heme A synthase
VGLTFVVLTLGALTANLPGAAPACQGFPLCNGTLAPEGGGAHVHLTHRILAFLLFFHVLGLMIGVARRGEPRLVVRAARLAFAAIVLQILIAAALVEMHLPRTLQSLHQATGTLVWLATCILAMVARRAAGSAAFVGAGLPVGNEVVMGSSRAVAARSAGGSER